MPNSRIITRLTLVYVLLCLIPAVIACAFAMSWQQQQLISELNSRLTDVAILFGESLDNEFSRGATADLQKRVRELGQRAAVRITLVDNGGVVLADSEKIDIADVATMNNHGDRPELRAAAESGEGRATRISPTVGSRFVYYARRLDRDGSSVGFVRTSVRTSTMRERVRQTWRQLGLLALVIGLLNLAMIYYAVTRFMKRLSALRIAADAIASGDYHQRVEVANDEDGGLGVSFNRMSAELSKTVTELRKRGEQLATVLGGMVEAVIAIDDRQRVLFANRSAGKLLEFDSDRASGKSLLETVRSQTLHSAAAEAFESGEPVQREAELGGTVNRTLTIHAAPLPGSPCPGVVLVIMDVTDLRRLEGLRQEFIANVSHELKTPLSSIKAYSETLLNGALSDTSNNQRFVQRIAEQSDRLQQLILDMLSLARIESAQKSYEIAAVSVEAVVEESLSGHQENAAVKEIELLAKPPESPVNVKAESEALRQILDNLVKNAIMYTGSGGTVSVSWTASQDMVAISVRDTGIGISKQDQARLFERFFRVDKARSRELGGTGLGLSIVKHLTQFFGGTVSVESQPGIGSIFTVCLPKA